MRELSETALEAAADVLAAHGKQHHWFDAESWRELDPIGREEFLGIVTSIVSAYVEVEARD